MILVDTSVWIDHLHSGDAALVRLLEANDVAVHPMVVGELALGSIRRRGDVLAHLARLPAVVRVSDHEALTLVENAELHGRGLSLVDVHLLGSTLVTLGCRLWTRDRRLRSVADRRGVAWKP